MATLSTSLMPPPTRAISGSAPGSATKPAHSTTPSARSSTAANPTLSTTASARSSATASAAATIPSALRALVKWAQYLVQHRAQELSLHTLFAIATKLRSPRTNARSLKLSSWIQGKSSSVFTRLAW